MAIDRKNSFHLLLSDDELALLRLLAEREGLNASDYLRTTLRRLAGPAPHMADAIRIGELLRARGVSADRMAESFEALKSGAKSKTKKAR